MNPPQSGAILDPRQTTTGPEETLMDETNRPPRWIATAIQVSRSVDVRLPWQRDVRNEPATAAPMSRAEDSLIRA